MVEPWRWIVGGGALALGLILLGVLRLLRSKNAASEDVSEPQLTERIAPRDRSAGVSRPYVLVIADDIRRELLAQAIGMYGIQVKSIAELRSAEAKRHPVIAFVNVDRLASELPQLVAIPVIGVVDTQPNATLAAMIDLLATHPTLTHVISANLLTAPIGPGHLRSLLERIVGGPEQDVLDSASVGRVAMLAQASRREQRFERMQGYFSKYGLSTRTIAAIYEVAEELVMNALYNAPTEAGYFKAPVSRADDVVLPFDRACEISYGMEDDNAFVRLRDTFGALRHERLLEVLARCNKDGVVLDESRGGAGLGMWRVFSSATTIMITVIPGRLTDVLVRMAPRQGKTAKQLLAIDLYFLRNSDKLDTLLLEEKRQRLEESITLLHQN